MVNNQDITSYDYLRSKINEEISTDYVYLQCLNLKYLRIPNNPHYSRYMSKQVAWNKLNIKRTNQHHLHNHSDLKLRCLSPKKKPSITGAHYSSHHIKKGEKPTPRQNERKKQIKEFKPCTVISFHIFLRKKKLPPSFHKRST